MELTEFQYQYVVGSANKIKLTVSEKYLVHSPEDWNRVINVLEQLNAVPEMSSCVKCDGYQRAMAANKAIQKFINQYELNKR